jgi:CRP/FNR family transcriptional regulator
MSAVSESVRKDSFNIKNATGKLLKNIQTTYPNLARLDDPAWQEIIDSAKLVQMPSGMLLMEPPSPCTQFMLILEGCVRVYQQTPDDREITLYRTYAGDLCVLSVNGLMRTQEFGAFAKTESEVVALVMSREQFMRAIAVSSMFREYVLSNLTDRINDVLQLVETTVFESLDSRLMCYLNRLSRRTDCDTLYLTHQELARELGTSREVISRILKAFERQGCIIQERGAICLTI